MDETQQLLAAASAYFERLAAPNPPTIDAYVASVEPELRAELSALLGEAIERGEPLALPTLAAAERLRAVAIAAGVRARHLTPALTLLGLRRASGRSVADLARGIGLPVMVLARIERGEVLAATIPSLLTTRLAAALGTVEATIAAALHQPTLASGARLMAKSGTVARPQPQVSFDAALREAGVPAAARDAWGT